jgi:hypothetical protein
MMTTTSGISRRTLLASAGAAALGAAVNSRPFGASATAATRRAAGWGQRALTNPLVRRAATRRSGWTTTASTT